MKMPRILTLRCAVCGRLRTLRGRSATFVRDGLRAGGRDVEYGDSVEIEACTANGCLKAAFEAAIRRDPAAGN